MAGLVVNIMNILSYVVPIYSYSIHGAEPGRNYSVFWQGCPSHSFDLVFLSFLNSIVPNYGYNTDFSPQLTNVRVISLKIKIKRSHPSPKAESGR